MNVWTLHAMAYMWIWTWSVCTFVNLKKWENMSKEGNYFTLQMSFLFFLFDLFFVLFCFLEKLINKAPPSVLHKVILSCVTFKENSSYAVAQLGVLWQMMEYSSTSTHRLPLKYRVCINRIIWIIKMKVAPWSDCAVSFFFIYFFIFQ